MTNDQNALLQSWRDDTPGCRERIHLNNAGAGLMPTSVANAVIHHIELETLRGGYEAAAARAGEIAECYENIARLCNTKPYNIAITDSATTAFVQALSTVDFQPGDCLVTSRLDYTSYQIQYASLSKRLGVEIIRAPDLPEGGIDPEGVRRILTDNRKCKLVSVSWIPTHAGTVQDVVAVGSVCEDLDIPYHIDACQAIGQMEVDVTTLHCDYLSATGRKFLRGPRGTGFLYVSDRALLRGDFPLHIDMRGAKWIAADDFMPESGAKRFEHWEFAYALVLGLGEAARYATAAGVKNCAARAQSLATYARDRLGTVPGARLLDRGKELSAIITVDFAGRSASELVASLGNRGINTVTTLQWYGLLDLGERGIDSAVRISPHYYNTTDEIDALIEALS